MCESTVYLTSDGQEGEIMRDVVLLQPEGDVLLLANLLGERKLVRGTIRKIDLPGHPPRRPLRLEEGHQDGHRHPHLRILPWLLASLLPGHAAHRLPQRQAGRLPHRRRQESHRLPGEWPETSGGGNVPPVSALSHVSTHPPLGCLSPGAQFHAPRAGGGLRPNGQGQGGKGAGCSVWPSRTFR